MSLNAMSLCAPVADALQTKLKVSPSFYIQGELKRKVHLGMKASLRVESSIRGVVDVELGRCTVQVDLVENLSMVMRSDQATKKMTVWLYDNCKHRFLNVLFDDPDEQIDAALVGSTGAKFVRGLAHESSCWVKV